MDSDTQISAMKPIPRRPVPAPTPRDRPPGPIALLKALRSNPITIWTHRHFDEKVVMRRTIIGPVCVVSDPRAIRHVLLDNAANYRKGVLQTRLLRPGLGNGLLTAEGESWRQQRRILAPAFTPRLIDSTKPAMAYVAARLVERWSALPDGSRLDVADVMAHTALKVLERTIFSDGLASEPETLTRAVAGYLDTLGRVHPFDALDLPAFLPRFGRNLGLQSLAIFNTVIETIITQRRALLARGERRPEDLLTLLIEAQSFGLSLDEVKANVATFIAAGHETTANALAWSLFLLAFEPRWRERLETEIDEVLGDDGDLASCDIERLTVTKAIVEESLRLYPPAPAISRQPIGKDRIGGHEVDRRTRVVISPWILHRHRKLWDEPDCFDPARFLPPAREKIDRYAYLPFGAGPRICIGAGFALQEAIILLAAIARHFRLDLAPGHEVMPMQRLTLRPRGGLPMILRRR